MMTTPMLMMPPILARRTEPALDQLKGITTCAPGYYHAVYYVAELDALETEPIVAWGIVEVEDGAGELLQRVVPLVLMDPEDGGTFGLMEDASSAANFLGVHLRGRKLERFRALLPGWKVRQAQEAERTAAAVRQERREEEARRLLRMQRTLTGSMPVPVRE